MILRPLHRVTSPASPSHLPLSVGRLERLLEEISLPRFSFEVLVDPYRVRAVMCIDPSELKMSEPFVPPGDTLTSSVRSLPVELPDLCSDAEILNVVAYVAICIVTHEVQEQFFFRGIDVINPHQQRDLFQDVCLERRSVKGNHSRTVFEIAQRLGMIAPDSLFASLPTVHYPPTLPV